MRRKREDVVERGQREGRRQKEEEEEEFAMGIQ